MTEPSKESPKDALRRLSEIKADSVSSLITLAIPAGSQYL